jgi:ParB family chromosome partitioning protein
MATPKRPALGRGLSALLNDNSAVTAQDPGARDVVSSIFEVALSQIQANPKQPRTQFEPGPLEELAESIRQLGIIQPITVRRIEADRFEIISGERRFRAAQLAGIERVPVYVRLADDQQMLEMALVENIQRRDLDPMEVAFSYQRLMEECSLTQQQVSERVGKQRSTVANFLGLLKLTPLIQAGLRDRTISAGHAKALVGLEDPNVQDELYMDSVAQQWSVRQLEEAVRLVQNPDGIPGSETPEALAARGRNINDVASAQAFKNILGLAAKVTKTAQGAGTVTLKFRSEDELQKALKKLGF